MGRRSQIRLTPRDLELLGFCAEHRLVLADHAAALLGVSGETARKRLAALSHNGLVTVRRPFDRGPGCYQIATAGLAAIDSDLRPPRRLDLRSYDHETGAAWVWLAARRGAFGALSEIVAERRLRSSDARPDRAGAPYGVRLGGVGPGGRDRLHYPDLLLITPGGRRIAVELELSGKARVRRERILAGYGADARTDAVLYLVTDGRIGRSIQESARRVGLSPLVHVQQVALGRGAPQGAARTAQRVRTRPRVAEEPVR